MRIRILALMTLVALPLAAACGGESTRTVEVGDAFVMDVPETLVADQDVIGFDSLVGEMGNADMTLSYDFGGDAGAPGFDGQKPGKVSLLHIDGHSATIEYYEEAGTYPRVAALHVDLDGAGLTMIARAVDEDALDRAVDIFRSIEFSEGATNVTEPGGEVDAASPGTDTQS